MDDNEIKTSNWGRPKGIPCSPETKKKIGDAVRLAHQLKFASQSEEKKEEVK